ncbi:hypothetical protein ACIBKX_31345 [Streptomyces sp. NPDC050658]|uniref:hypothetical protein n=1 Tax=unclassified Streptomyces TaxID=2593676 RepID=UPI00343966CA
MTISDSRGSATLIRRRRGTVAAVAAPLLAAVSALALTGCGQLRAGDSPTPSSPSTTSSSSPKAPGPSPYVEPGVVDGAPHNGDNNAYRRPGEMTPAGEEAAKAEAARMGPVLKQLHRQKKWDPESVRAALTGKLGYELREVTSKGKLLGGELDVQDMYQRYEGDDYVTPEGAMIALYVPGHACVTAFVQPTNYGVKTNGAFPETGCMEPPIGH